MREMDRIEVLRILESMSETEWMTLGEISSASAHKAGSLHPNTVGRHLRTTAWLYVEQRGKTVVSPRGHRYLVNQYRRKPGSLDLLKGTTCQKQQPKRNLMLRS